MLFEKSLNCNSTGRMQEGKGCRVAWLQSFLQIETDRLLP
jgi:hypothetical protein